jgi:hypothetical protein
MYVQAHILAAQIHLANQYPKLAMQSLEMALSYNFEVRGIPLFHILKAKALKQQGQFEDALGILTAALNMPSVKDMSTNKTSKTSKNLYLSLIVESKPTFQSKKSDTVPTMSERATLYIELADVQSKLKKAVS